MGRDLLVVWLFPASPHLLQVAMKICPWGPETQKPSRTDGNILLEAVARGGELPKLLPSSSRGAICSHKRCLGSCSILERPNYMVNISPRQSENHWLCNLSLCTLDFVRECIVLKHYGHKCLEVTKMEQVHPEIGKESILVRKSIGRYNAIWA